LQEKIPEGVGYYEYNPSEEMGKEFQSE